jgi:hypothetical protein
MDFVFDDDGDTVMGAHLAAAAAVATATPESCSAPPTPTLTVHKYTVELQLEYRHIFDADALGIRGPEGTQDWYEDGDSDADDEDDDADSPDGKIVPCNDDNCSCSGDELPATRSEVDAFMRANYQGLPRYKLFALAVMTSMIETGDAEIADYTYADGGKLSFTLNYKCLPSAKPTAEQIADDIIGSSFEDTLYEGAPGNEAIVPTKHKYGVVGGFTGDVFDTYHVLGYIDCREASQVAIREV